MNMRQTLYVLLAAAALAPVSRADELPKEPSMIGVGPVVLTIYTDGGLDKGLIEREARQDLKNVGIKVIDDPLGIRSDSVRLYLDANLACTGKACGYRTRLWLEEPVKLVRKPSVTVKATTWSNGYGHAIQRSDLLSLPPLMASDIYTLIGLFAAEVNGKIPPP
jgi:hypothetical protein